jgi:rubrerythrin
MDLGEQLTKRYMTQLVATPEGRAHVLHQCAEAEDSDEAQVFDRVLAVIDDPELAQLVKRHMADETRHAAMFRERLAATGVTPPPIPDDLRLLARIDRALGGARPVVDRTGVMEAYVLLQVIEERATTQFGIHEAVFRPIDPKTADVYAAIAKDEARHLKYCHAIGRRYAPDEATYLATVRRYRKIEARAFAANGRANMKYVFANDYIDMGSVQRAGWRALSGVASLLRGGQPTRFSREDARATKSARAASSRSEEAASTSLAA